MRHIFTYEMGGGEVTTSCIILAIVRCTWELLIRLLSFRSFFRRRARGGTNEAITGKVKHIYISIECVSQWSRSRSGLTQAAVARHSWLHALLDKPQKKKKQKLGCQIAVEQISMGAAEMAAFTKVDCPLPHNKK